jgi:predicted RecB family nuclease
MTKSTVHPPYSASSLCDFAGCRYILWLDRLAETENIKRVEDDDSTKLTQKKGHEHERRYLEYLESDGNQVVTAPRADIASEEARLRSRQTTIDILSAGPQYVYQPYVYSSPFQGFADFFKRVDRPSKLGSFSYEIIDTKLSKQEKVTHIIQLCLYSELLGDIQGELPEKIHIVTGDSKPKSFRLHDYFSYYLRLKSDFLASINDESLSRLYPEPCYRCAICRWREHCAEKRAKDDHLSLVANISRGQRVKLALSGITTCAQLADSRTPHPASIPRGTFEKLQEQAALQKNAEKTGIPRYKFISPNQGGRGLSLLPPLNEGDLFYDIEADPHVKETTSSPGMIDGLQYLHGFSWRKADGSFEYRAFWALTKREERRCFEEVMDFIGDRLRAHPGASVYHYSSYETCALKRLSAQYPSRVNQLDDLLRADKFCDLYTIVRQSIRVSEPKYSIKNLEHFYSKARDQAVTGSGASIVWFEEYLETGNRKLLEDLRDYNQKDCDSMIELYDWLSELKVEFAAEFGVVPAKPAPKSARNDSRSQKSNDRERGTDEERMARFRTLLRIDELDARDDKKPYTEIELLRLRLFYMADFYRREMKSTWWALFSKKDLMSFELLEDTEVLADCRIDTIIPPTPEQKSTLIRYTFPEQEFSLREQDTLWDIDNHRNLGKALAIDIEKRAVTIAISNQVEMDERVKLLNLAKTPVDMVRHLKKGLDRFITAVGGYELSRLREGNREYPYAALVDILLQDGPAFTDGPRDTIVNVGADDSTFREKLTDAALKLDRSYLIIQGPPGTGKTFHGARLAVSLMRHGKRLGVMSNSHKAILNFLNEVDTVAHDEQFKFKGVKVSKEDAPVNQYLINRPPDSPPAQIEDCFDKASIDPSEINLMAGTAWAFYPEQFDQRLDYLIIDEASQVSLAHLISAGVSARNLILIGDPCQLPQPLQGIHPVGMDLSPLEYILNGYATVPPHLGVFLEVCRRMHGDICELLSRQVYESRLSAAPENTNQRILAPESFSIPKKAGYYFYPVEHDGNTNASAEEARSVSILYRELLTCGFRDKDDTERPITPNDIMIISPYNKQVEEIQNLLPKASVGTVDKFQGREAPVVIASMATSSLEDTPRGLDFLFSQQRINVLLSRAKALVIVVGSPKLFQARCSNTEQMKLLNFFYALGPVRYPMKIQSADR